MPDQYATTTHTRTTTVAQGPYAPGHLGELTRYLPFELIDDALKRTNTWQQRQCPCPPASASTSS
ncbi:hypothetical protein GCM10028793_21320 [Nocardiopsis oceani]